MSYRAIREWMQKVDEMGELKISSRMIIDACRSFEWIKNFPAAAKIDSEYRKV